ncbi:hypothetical protein B296_00031185 [Ensete ventricosum]|uniref:Uncharacterized protein n=1 Tax=Ensete ventricosum TaxID=4639 RepID=A0A426Y8R3_ENSVE|nr:hypothetical protein B296_00031185 [Ensete ventricosum]
MSPVIGTPEYFRTLCQLLSKAMSVVLFSISRAIFTTVPSLLDSEACSPNS